MQLKHNTHSSVKGKKKKKTKKNEVTPLNTGRIFLVFVVFSAAGVTNRDLNAMGSDIRGAIALQSLDRWSILVDGTNVKRTQ
jgi:hypothetical protein